MNILSIDWDYFFPDSMPYDWGHNENNFLYYDIIWQTRVSSINIFTREECLEAFIPTIPNDFWNIVTNRPKLYVADSHFRIWSMLDMIGNVKSITNLDAHHDCGYRLPKIDDDFVDCGNWGRWAVLLGKTDELNLHYPQWRQGEEEWSDENQPLELNNVSYELPKPQDYDAIFVCRSSSWTPPWFDGLFETLIDNAPFSSKEIIDNSLDIKRSITNIEDACSIKKSTDQMNKTFKKEIESSYVN